MEERRNDVELKVISERLDNLVKQIDKSDEISLEWRNRFCKKLDALTEKIDNLPCPVRVEQTKGIMLQLRGLWILVSAILLGVIAEWLKLK